MSDPAPLTDAWFAAKAKGLPWFRAQDAESLRATMMPGSVIDPTYCQTPILRDVSAAAIEEAARMVDSDFGSNTATAHRLRALAEEIRKEST